VEESREIFNKSTYQASPKIITIGIAGITGDQLATLNAAIATNDEASVRATVNALAAGATAASDPAATDPAAATETPAEGTGDAQTSEESQQQ
jgi:hypothetical protein